MFTGVQQVSSMPRRAREQTVAFGPWPMGITTEHQPELHRRQDLFDALNFVLLKDGISRTRDGLTLIASGATGELKCCRDVNVGGTWYTLVTDDDNKLYKDVAGTLTQISSPAAGGVLEGTARLIGYLGVLIICDGGYLKYWDGTNLKMCYDDGTGTSTDAAYQFNNRNGDIDAGTALNSTTTAVAYQYTTASWTTGYTIPPTTFTCWLKKVGVGYSGTDNVNIDVKIATTGGTLMASKTLISAPIDASGLSATEYLEFSVTFSASDITTELSPGTVYRVYVEYTNGGASNHVLVGYTTVTSGGRYNEFTSSAWVGLDTLKQPCFSLKPGLPPKLVDAIVHKNRLWGIEGENGTNPSYLWFSGAGNYLSYSTAAGAADGGGYVSAIDASATQFPIGAIRSWYKSLWLFGLPRQPYLAELTGNDITDFAINDTLQRVSGHYLSTIVMPDDVHFLHPGGVDALTNIQEYGDVQATRLTDALRYTIQNNYSTAAFAGYDPKWGLFVLQLAGVDYAIVIHTQLVATRHQGQTIIAGSPMTKWKFSLGANVTPTAFGDGNGYMLVGSSDGKVYKTDPSVTTDNEATPSYRLITHAENTRFGDMCARKVSANAYSTAAASFDLTFYRNYNRTALLTKSLSVKADPGFDTAAQSDYYDRLEVDFNFRSLAIELDNVTLNAKPLYVHDIAVLAHYVGGM